MNQEELEGLFINYLKQKCNIYNNYDLYKIKSEFKCKITNENKRTIQILYNISMKKDKLTEIVNFRIIDELMHRNWRITIKFR